MMAMPSLRATGTKNGMHGRRLQREVLGQFEGPRSGLMLAGQLGIKLMLDRRDD